MKITRLMLENFIGIYAGTGRTKIDIDFTKNKNRIIILNGENGSGKSTLKSLCHPLRGTFDNRSNIVLPGELGHSICELELNDGRKCRTEHYYGKKNKSFISIDGTELNESGSIRQFEEIAERELGITGDYFKIGSLGSNVSNFVDLKATQRKIYINQFIPDVDDYLNAFEIIKDKHKSLSTELKIIKGNIEKYSNLRELDEIEEELKTLKSNKETYDKELLQAEKDFSMFEEKYDSLIKNIYEIMEQNSELKKAMSDYDDINISDLGIILDDTDVEITNKIVTIKNNIDEFIEKYHLEIGDPYKAVKTLLKKNEEKNIKFENQLKNIDESLNKLEDEKIEAENNRTQYSNNLKETSNLNQEDIETIKEKLEEYNSNLNILEKKNELFKNSKSFNEEYFNELEDFYKDYSFSEIDYLPKLITQVIDKIDGFKEDYEINDLESFYERNKNNNYSKISSIKNKLSELEENKKILGKKLNELTSKEEFVLKNISKRPKNCKDDTCPFISSSVDFIENKKPEIKELEKEIKRIETEYDNNNLILENLEKDFTINNFLNQLKKSLLKKFPEIIVNNFMKRNILIDNIYKVEEFEMIKKYSEYKSNLYNIDSINNSKNAYMEKIKNYELSSSIIEEYNSLIEKYSNKYNECTLKISKLNEEEELCINELKKAKSRIQLCESFIETFDKYNNLIDISNGIKNIYKLVSSKFKEAEKIQTDIEDGIAEEKINNLKKIIKELEEKINTTTTSIQIIKDNLERLSKIEEDFEKIDLIKKSLDPKSGIPLIFINSFLTNISQKTNELLSIAYDDSFKIKFNVTASEFKIEVYKNDGTFLEDISQASQGEQSLTSTSLSLAMIESVIKPDEYNIVNLDEVDATLSTENRRLFIDMLEKQLDVLGCEQCFVISHNGEFYNKDVDLILFKGHDCDLNDEEFMKNKNILANFG